MRTVTNIFIVNLAVADFFVILLCLPPTVVWDVTETWFLGETLCKVVIYFQVCVSFIQLHDTVCCRYLGNSNSDCLYSTGERLFTSAKLTTSCSRTCQKKALEQNVAENCELRFNKTDVNAILRSMFN